MLTYYNSLLQGDNGALKRALYKSIGFTEEALSKPLVAVVNSYTNATPGHANLNLLQDQAPRGRVVDYRVPLTVNGVHVLPGDLVFGDRDGVLVIPQDIEREVIERACWQFDASRHERCRSFYSLWNYVRSFRNSSGWIPRKDL